LKVLFDQSAPSSLARFLAHHQVIRSAELGLVSAQERRVLQDAEEDAFEASRISDPSGD
jgi:hypothetical protein